MKAMKHLLSCALLLACVWTSAQAASVGAAERAAARAQITKERSENDKQLQENEKICYQRFAVTDCLKKVRSQSNEQERALRQRELAINAQERGERTEGQRAARDKKQQDFENKHHSNPLDGGALKEPDLEQRQREHEAAASKRAAGERNPQELAAEQHQRQQDAAQRAADAQKKAASKQQAQQNRAATLPVDISGAREEFDAKQADAAQRQLAHDKKMKELQAKSRKAAPLPTPP
ncbi:MAG: hypothetical protein RSG22_08310 [Comamonas sp.]